MDIYISLYGGEVFEFPYEYPAAIYLLSWRHTLLPLFKCYFLIEYDVLLRVEMDFVEENKYIEQMFRLNFVLEI